MMRRLSSILLACLVCGVAWGQAEEQRAAAEPTTVRTVRVTAEGYNRDDALKQALRQALEQGGEVQIASYSQVSNFELIRDTIYSRAAGIVTDYRIVEEKPGPGGTVLMTIEAQVRNSAIAEAWGEVQNVLDQVGRPRMMVVIDETIDGELQRDSIVAARIEQMFAKAGFDLVERGAIEDLLRREGEDALKEGNDAKFQRLAKDAGAHILIRGSANANQAGLENLYGVPAAFYNCDVLAKVYWTDTGRLVTSESIPVTRRGVRARREYSPQAARDALVQATFPDVPPGPRRQPPLAVRLYESTMEQWATQISFGGEIMLEVEGLNFRAYTQLRRALAELERVESVQGDFTRGQGVFRLRAKVSADTLAERLTDPPFDRLIEVIDLKPNRIQAKATDE
jgi:hypothetical protein